MKLPKSLLFYFLFGSGLQQAIGQQNVFDVQAMQSDPKTYSAIKIKNPITIDGRAAEIDWQKAEWSSDFVDITHADDLMPTLQTRVKMLWDDQHLYLYAEMQEPHIWADIVQHDAIIYHNNDFEVFIKPSSQQEIYYELEVNPLNTILDLAMTKPYRYNGEALIHWDLKGLKSAVHHQGTLNNPNDTDQYWSVEMAIPFQSILAFGKGKKPVANSQWQINFSRVQWQHSVENGIYQRKKLHNKLLEEHNWVWSPIGIINMHYPERWGYVQFVESPTSSITLPKAYSIQKLIWNVHYLQQLHFNTNKKYASKLKDLAGYDQFLALAIKEYDVEIWTNKLFDAYQMTAINKETKEKLSIDHRGNTY